MRNTPTSSFWNCIGIAIAISSIGLSWSLIRANNYKLEAANHKLEVNAAVEEVKKVSDTLAESVEHLPNKEKQEIQAELEKANQNLIKTQEEILADDESGDSL